TCAPTRAPEHVRTSARAVGAPVSLEARDLTAAYPGRGAPTACAGRVVLDRLSLSVAPGECLAVVGPNGAGKSTLVKVLSGQLRPLAGTVAVDGAPLASLSRFASARRVSVVEQNPVLPAGFPAAAVVAMGRTPHLGLFGVPNATDDDHVRRAMIETGTTPLADRLVETLSGGERQRVVLA